MTAFVIEQANEKIYEDEFYMRVVGYAEFLNQPLTLGMFYGENKLFEDFEIYNEYCVRHLMIAGIYIDEEYCLEHTVEDLVGAEWITLTPSALKQIGIKE